VAVRCKGAEKYLETLVFDEWSPHPNRKYIGAASSTGSIAIQSSEGRLCMHLTVGIQQGDFAFCVVLTNPLLRRSQRRSGL
jgi:hypothetical protein